MHLAEKKNGEYTGGEVTFDNKLKFMVMVGRLSSNMVSGGRRGYKTEWNGANGGDIELRAAVLARKAPTQVQSSVSICNTFPTTTGFTAARISTNTSFNAISWDDVLLGAKGWNVGAAYAPMNKSAGFAFCLFHAATSVIFSLSPSNGTNARFKICFCIISCTSKKNARPAGVNSTYCFVRVNSWTLTISSSLRIC